jgi:hypothetical protein
LKKPKHKDENKDTESISIKYFKNVNFRCQNSNYLPPLVLGAIRIKNFVTQTQSQFLSCLLEISPKQICKQTKTRIKIEKKKEKEIYCYNNDKNLIFIQKNTNQTLFCWQEQETGHLKESQPLPE